MKELVFEELSLKQKLGMTFTAFLNSRAYAKEDNDFVFDLIREKALGSVWIQHGFGDADELIREVREIADYPILIVTDAEGGIADCVAGRHGAIGCTGDEKYAYAFGKAVGATARKLGYDIVCNPLLDMKRGSMRSLGTDKEKVASLAIAEARGMHDGGVLTLGKHYPSGRAMYPVDTHMAEEVSEDTKEELIEYALYPYKKLIENDLLDGIMSGHTRFINIDPTRPATLSKPVLDIIRELGFEGIIMTDALNMMGIRAKYDFVEAYGYAKGAGNDTILPFMQNTSQKFKEYTEAYEKGLIPDDILDASGKRILAAQHKALMLTREPEITEEDMDVFGKIDSDSVYAKSDDNVSVTLPRDGNHFFGVMISNEIRLDAENHIDVDTYSSKWYFPEKIEKQLKELFPNSKVQFFYQFPSQKNNMEILQNSIDCDETVFLTFTEPICYTGKEHLTQRFQSLVEAMQITNRVSAILHFGNPCVLEPLPHIPRYIIGCLSEKGVRTAIDILAGEYEPKGVLNCDVNLK